MSESPEMSLNDMVRTGTEHHKYGRLPDAERMFRQVLEKDPNHARALHGLAGIALHVGRGDASLALVNRAIEIEPNEPNFHGAAGVVRMAQKQWPEAAAAFRRAVELQPTLFQWNIHLADALRMQGASEESAATFIRTIDMLPDLPEAFFHVGTMLLQLGKMPEAVRCARKAVALRPDYAEAYNTLGMGLLQSGQKDEAIEALRRVVELRPNDVPSLNNFASLLGVVGQSEESIQILRRVLTLEPENATARHNLGNALKDHGNLEAAVGEYKKAAVIDPSYDATESNRLYALHFHPAYDAAALHREHVKWGEQIAGSSPAQIGSHQNDRSPERRLRVGYISPDLRHHVVGWNLRPLLREHDRAQFEIYCYASVTAPDDLTAEFQTYADVWRDIVGLSDEQLAEQIRQDQIDILVDLSLHADNNRLMAFAHKPAPVQVTYLGYPGTTGLATMDYRLSDPYIDPFDEDLNFYTEKTIRLPKSYWCYQPGGPTPDVIPLPALTSGFLTLGCLNNFAKVSSAALQLWGRVMKQLPESRLLIHGPSRSPEYEVFQRFASAGVPIHRLQFIPPQTYGQYLENYDRIDLALDPFPFNGGITTCDALWMGVPVVTMRGGTGVGRAGSSILHNVGLPELIATSPDEYVNIATHLARDLPRLGQLRADLRARMQASPLMDAIGFARGVEDAFREMWRNWCAGRSPKDASAAADAATHQHPAAPLSA